MAKELPYFRFTSAEWLNDDISLESYEVKGIFIDVCAYYWAKDCDVTLALLHRKFSNATVLLQHLIDLGIIKHESRHDKVKIDFLMKQYDLLSEKRKARQDAGSKGGNATAMLKQKRSYKDKDNNKDNNKDILRFDFKSRMMLEGFEENLITEWLAIRKKKKSTNSETAFNKFLNEVKKIVDRSPNEVLKICVEKSWAGFESEWINKPQNTQQNQQNQQTKGDVLMNLIKINSNE